MNGAAMPTDAPLDSTDPWDDIARELTTEGEQSDETANESPAEKAVAHEAPLEEPPVEEAPVGESAHAADERSADEPVAQETDLTGTENAAGKEGSADWNFLASELGLESGGPPPLKEENPADELFSDFTPTVLEEDQPVPFTDDEPSTDDEGQSSDDDDEASSREQSRRPTRQRGSRRGRRHRTEKEDEATGDDGETRAAEKVPEGESPDAEKPTRRRRSRRRGKRGGTDSREVGVDEVGSESEDSEKEEASAKPTHRKIPTWGEAISVVVEANIEGRGKDSGRKAGRGPKKKGRR